MFHILAFYKAFIDAATTLTEFSTLTNGDRVFGEKNAHYIHGSDL